MRRGPGLESTINKALQQVAVLVQGCWVIKSDILYPLESDDKTNKNNKNKSCYETGTSFQMLRRARNCVVCDIII